MSDPSSPDYKLLYQTELDRRQQAEDGQRREREQRQHAEQQRQHAEQQRQHAEQQRQHAEQQRQHAEQQRQQAEARQHQVEERNRSTTFDEYIQLCHDLLSVPLKIGHPSRSTRGTIPQPTGKYCPTQFCEWADFHTQQTRVYSIVRQYLQPAQQALRLFTPRPTLEDLGRLQCRRRLRSEKDLEVFARVGVEDHVQDIFDALYNSVEARTTLQLGNGLHFDNHANDIDQEEEQERDTDMTLGIPDQFCIHRQDGNETTLLTSVEYKPPHKLPIGTLCLGLQPGRFYDDVVNVETIPTDEAEKVQYNARQLAGSAVVQQYHVMIQEGLTYSYLFTGEALVFLYVPESDPSTLHYHLCVPNKDIEAEDSDDLFTPMTTIARVLCLCLMCHQQPLRDNAWRNKVMTQLQLWETSFDYTRDQLSNEDLANTSSGSEYIPSSPVSSPAPANRKRGSIARCTPSPTTNRDDPESSDSDSSPPTSRPQHKRNLSAITSSPPQPRKPPSYQDVRENRGQQRRPVTAFCTQKCLLGLRDQGTLDDNCPNMSKHRAGQDTDHHLINAADLQKLLKQQLGKDPDHLCIPYGERGRYGAPFKIASAAYGYTIVGKGTTARGWQRISQEAPIYEHMRSIQGTAVPVFLGTLDLEQTFFLHGAGAIRHMLLMAWGGDILTREQVTDCKEEISRCRAALTKLGVRHEDWRRHNLLWNAEYGRVFAIDFDKSKISLKKGRVMSLKRACPASPWRDSRKRNRVISSVN